MPPAKLLFADSNLHSMHFSENDNIHNWDIAWVVFQKGFSFNLTSSPPTPPPTPFYLNYVRGRNSFLRRSQYSGGILDGRSGVLILASRKTYLYFNTSRTAVGPKETTIHGALWLLIQGVKRPRRESEYHHLVPTLRKSGVIPPIPLHPFSDVVSIVKGNWLDGPGLLSWHGKKLISASTRPERL